MLPRRTREPRTGQSAQRARHQDAASIDLVPEVVTEEEEANDETILPLGDGEEPDWLPDAAEVFSGYRAPANFRRRMLPTHGMPWKPRESRAMWRWLRKWKKPARLQL
jgi:hypothetical protein